MVGRKMVKILSQVTRESLSEKVYFGGGCCVIICRKNSTGKGTAGLGGPDVRTYLGGLRSSEEDCVLKENRAWLS